MELGKKKRKKTVLAAVLEVNLGIQLWLLQVRVSEMLK